MEKHQRDSDIGKIRDQMDIKERELSVFNRKVGLFVLSSLTSLNDGIINRVWGNLIVKIENIEEQLKDREMKSAQLDF